MSRQTTSAERRRLNVMTEKHHPAYVVWELTLRCDHACRHCGSRAGAARPDELGTEAALDIVRQLAEMGAREVVLIGGEAYLHEGFIEVLTALRRAGISPTVVSGGLAIDADLARDMVGAGVERVSVSVDGLEQSHDQLRMPGSFAAATKALGHLKDAGIRTGTNTTINRLNRADLEGLYEHLRQAGVGAWQLQIMVPMGRAADRPDMMLQPYDLIEIMPRVAALKKRAYEDNILIMPGNNLGYFGPEEALLRSLQPEHRDCFLGCTAGRFILGIESDGSVKGCLSLQSASYVAGNVGEQSLAQLWEQAPKLAFTRQRPVAHLWGYCQECPFADPCMSGCSFTSHALFGRPGNNPYCHFRARHFAKQGKRERLVAEKPASGKPMDHGLFRIELEDLDAPDPGANLDPEQLVKISRKPLRGDDPAWCR